MPRTVLVLQREPVSLSVLCSGPSLIKCKDSGCSRANHQEPQMPSSFRSVNVRKNISHLIKHYSSNYWVSLPRQSQFEGHQVAAVVLIRLSIVLREIIITARIEISTSRQIARCCHVPRCTSRRIYTARHHDLSICRLHPDSDSVVVESS